MLFFLYFLIFVATPVTAVGVGAKDFSGMSRECQIRRPLRKQVEAEPLAGMCLKDIVVRLSKALRSIGNEELGLTAFQEMLDRLDITRSEEDPDSALASLVDKLNAKLASYDQLLELCDKSIQGILLKEQFYTLYDEDSVGSEHSARESAGLCTQIEHGASAGYV